LNPVDKSIGKLSQRASILRATDSFCNKSDIWKFFWGKFWEGSNLGIKR